jgi:hypothetical protein
VSAERDMTAQLLIQIVAEIDLTTVAIAIALIRRSTRLPRRAR